MKHELVNEESSFTGKATPSGLPQVMRKAEGHITYKVSLQSLHTRTWQYVLTEKKEEMGNALGYGK